jgi:hypothetical protein
MNNDESFDCVNLKNRIQAKLLREYEGLTPEQERAKRLQKLSTGDSLAAKMWQADRKPEKTTSR